MNSFIPLWCKNRLLKQKRLKNCVILITIIVACCICALIFSQSMMDGITKKYVYLSTGHITVKNLYEDQIQDFEESFYSSDSVISGNALLYSNENTSSLLIKGVSSEYFNEKRLGEIQLEVLQDNSNLSGIIISKETASLLNVNLGDKIALLILPDSKQGIIRPTIVRVKGVFSTGYDSLDKLFCYTDLDYAKLLFPSEESVTTEIILKDNFEDESLNFANLISKKYNVETNSWERMNLSVYRNFVSSKQTIFIILVIVVILAAFYVSSVARQLLYDDIYDLSLLKLIGADNSLIFKSELLTTYSVSLISIVFGSILGLILSIIFNPIMKILSKMSISTLSYYLLDFKIIIPLSSILGILLVLALISFLTLLLTLRKTKDINALQLFTQA